MAARYAEFHPETSSRAIRGATSTLDAGRGLLSSGDGGRQFHGVAGHADCGAGARGRRCPRLQPRRRAPAVLELRRFIASDRFEPPRRLWCGTDGAGMGAPLFERQAVAAWFDRSMAVAAGPRTGGGRILWDQSDPVCIAARLAQHLAGGYFSRKAWRQIKLLAFGMAGRGAGGGRSGVRTHAVLRGKLRVLPLWGRKRMHPR
jgi:hypothetical protein